MKKSIFIIVIALVSLLSITSCTTDLKKLNLVQFNNLTLDVQDGTGPHSYDGGKLPINTDGTLKKYIFSFTFQKNETISSDKTFLVMGPSTFPFKLFFNGEQIFTYGEEGTLEFSRRYQPTLLYIPASLVKKENTIEVIAQVRNERISLMEIAVTDQKAGSSYVFWRDLLMQKLQAGGLTIGFILLIYFFFMFILSGGKNLRFIWFSLFCGCFSLACVNVVFNHLAISDTFLTKIGRSGFVFCSPLLTLLIMETTGIFNNKKWIKYGEILLLAAGLIWINIQKDFMATNAAFNLIIQCIITPNLLFCLFLLIIAVIKKGFKEYAIMCVGIIGILITSVIDMRSEQAFYTPYAWSLVFGYTWFVICIFMELALKQERIAKKAVMQADQLERKNSILKSVFTHIQAGSNTLTASTEELAVSTREISATGKQQAVAVKEIVSTMEDADTLLKNISSKSSLVHQDSLATAIKADEGAVDVKNSLQMLETAIHRSAESITSITDFNNHLGSITEVVKLIESIAVKIRIIAFNASLEAVAAGEAGKNFTIVADEVKYLSDSTMASAKNIKERVSALLAMSNEVVKTSQEGYKELEQSMRIAAETGNSFSDIQNAAESSSVATANIDSSIKEETQAFAQIVLTLKEISAGVNNFVSAAQHTSETTDTLNGIAENLHEIINQYSSEFTDEVY